MMCQAQREESVVATEQTVLSARRYRRSLNILLLLVIVAKTWPLEIRLDCVPYFC